MKTRLILGSLAALLIAPVLWAASLEKQAQKLDKELRSISLTAAVIEGRRVVNRLMASQLGVSRKQLVEDRRATGFVYGQLFGAHEVARGAGLTFDQVAEQMKQGQSLLEICQQHHVDLKGILANTKKLNKKIKQELDWLATLEEDEQAEDAADSYDPLMDSLTADTAIFTSAEIVQASEQVRRRGPSVQRGPIDSSGEMGVGRGQSSSTVGGVGGRAGGGRGRGPH